MICRGVSRLYLPVMATEEVSLVLVAVTGQVSLKKKLMDESVVSLDWKLGHSNSNSNQTEPSPA